VAGLDGNQRYMVRFDVEIATNVENGCVGVGGAPGEHGPVRRASAVGAEATVERTRVSGSSWAPIRASRRRRASTILGSSLHLSQY